VPLCPGEKKGIEEGEQEKKGEGAFLTPFASEKDFSFWFSGGVKMRKHGTRENWKNRN
jgi:hypothetical protein